MNLEPRTLVIDRPCETYALPCRLQPGWHRLRLDLSSDANHGIRKRGEIRIGSATGHFAWNDRLQDEIVLKLDEPSDSIAVLLQYAQGRVSIERLTIQRISQARAAIRATNAKIALLSQFNCLGPVLRRGVRLLARGDVRTFARKLMNGLPDSRVMRVEAKTANEAGAAWWRREWMTAEQRRHFEQECEKIISPTPIAVILPVDPTRVDHARQAAFSVLRQIYPHWQLRILWPTLDVPDELSSAIRHDDRCRIDIGPFASALPKTLADVPCDLALVLSPDAELADEALLKLYETRTAMKLGEHAVIAPLKSFANTAHFTGSAFSILRWAQSLVPCSVTTSFVHSLDRGAGAAFAVPAIKPTRSIHLAANITGISGWDAVAFQVLRGMSRAGYEVKRHPAALVKTHTLPPGLSFEESPRRAEDLQLIIAAPFQVKAFSPDARSVVFTMWECDRLPAASVEVLNRARLVIVPSGWGLKTFRASGVTVPIAVIPLGVDPFVFSPSAGKTDEICVFGTAGALGAGGIRKNLMMVVNAFRTAFPTEVDVRLRIKITPNCPPIELPGDARIEVTRAVLPANEVADWNRSLTAYVNASFAEGFGLHLLEAMACGVPLISTAASGPADYFDETCGIVLPHRELNVKNEYYSGCWYEPDFNSMVAAMRRVHRERPVCLGEAAADRARQFTWRDTGRRLLNTIDKL